ncbi:hypothetical protein HK100_004080 [Physocladia obscura]|uniref:Uncharacterized protein n=1 Tax=Physocladia obscura TaxID=109957 RepID=A0AAD5ST90_9FUNG|nr:hypothetical protein HK100_004080 [Physocladia obscura]
MFPFGLPAHVPVLATPVYAVADPELTAEPAVGLAAGGEETEDVVLMGDGATDDVETDNAFNIAGQGVYPHEFVASQQNGVVDCGQREGATPSAGQAIFPFGLFVQLPVFPEETAPAVVGDAAAADNDDDDLVTVTVVVVEDDSALASTAATPRITKDFMPDNRAETVIK